MSFSASFIERYSTPLKQSNSINLPLFNSVMYVAKRCKKIYYFLYHFIKINYCQHRVKKIAGKSLLTKILADFLSVIYLLTLVLKPRNFLLHNHVVVHYKKYCNEIKFRQILDISSALDKLQRRQ
jgi:hypothetical protein